MNCCYRWYSYSGFATPDNRDYCGIVIKKDFSVFIIADGMTTSLHGGELAKELILSLLARFESSTRLPPEVTLRKWLREIHSDVRLAYFSDSTSYLLVIRNSEGEFTTLHAGDCLLGTVNAKMEIRWLLYPHTLANAISPMLHKDIARDPDRNKLTRSFRGKRFVEPEQNLILVSPEEAFLFASDGFWADLSPQEQKDLIRGKWQPQEKSDDISFLLLRNDFSKSYDATAHSENILYPNHSRLPSDYRFKLAK